MPSPLRGWAIVACGALVAALLVPRAAAAFSVFVERGDTAAEKASLAARWSAEPDPFGAGTGLHDGIQVAVESGFAAHLGSAELATLYGVSEASLVDLTAVAVRAAFHMWETPALRFDVEVDGPAVEGARLGREIDLFARPVSLQLFGYTDAAYELADARLLTNGQRLPGYVMLGADVYINTRRVLESARLLAQLHVPLSKLAAALQILIAHEVGHAIGLGHPNQLTFLDTDADPYNAMVIDPLDPFGDLIISAISANPPSRLLPIMWGGLSSANPSDLLGLLGRLDDPSLTFDDVGGRDVLYPTDLPPFTPTATISPSATPEATFTATATASPTATAIPCAGDCDHSGTVTVDELLAMVNIALEIAPVAACLSGNLDGNGQITVDEILAAVNRLLGDCGAA